MQGLSSAQGYSHAESHRGHAQLCPIQRGRSCDVNYWVRVEGVCAAAGVRRRPRRPASAPAIGSLSARRRNARPAATTGRAGRSRARGRAGAAPAPPPAAGAAPRRRTAQ